MVWFWPLYLRPQLPEACSVTDLTITVVAGFTRCGSTLMMRMLRSGGMEVFAEMEQSCETNLIFTLPDNDAWLTHCTGKALKLLDPHKNQPSPAFSYRFIWMDRDPKQQALSQLKLLRELGGMDFGSRKNMLAMKRANIADRPKALSAIKPHGPVMTVRFEDLLRDPLAEAYRVREFVGRDLDCMAMMQQVVPRSPRCLPHMLEAMYV
jgi:hypothetical protein